MPGLNVQNDDVVFRGMFPPTNETQLLMDFVGILNRSKCYGHHIDAYMHYPSKDEVQNIIDNKRHSDATKLYQLTGLWGPMLYFAYRYRNAGPVRSVYMNKEQDLLAELAYHPNLFPYFNTKCYSARYGGDGLRNYHSEDELLYSEVLAQIRIATINRNIAGAVQRKNLQVASEILDYATKEKIPLECPFSYSQDNDVHMIRLVLDHQQLARQSYTIPDFRYRNMDNGYFDVIDQSQTYEFHLGRELDQPKNASVRRDLFKSIINDLIKGEKNKWHHDAISTIARHSNWKEQLFNLLIETANQSSDPVSILQKALDPEANTTLYKIFAVKRGLGQFFTCFNPEADKTFKQIQKEIDNRSEQHLHIN